MNIVHLDWQLVVCDAGGATRPRPQAVVVEVRRICHLKKKRARRRAKPDAPPCEVTGIVSADAQMGSPAPLLQRPSHDEVEEESAGMEAEGTNDPDEDEDGAQSAAAENDFDEDEVVEALIQEMGSLRVRQ